MFYYSKFINIMNTTKKDIYTLVTYGGMEFLMLIHFFYIVFLFVFDKLYKLKIYYIKN